MTTLGICALCGSAGEKVGECSLCEIVRAKGCGRKGPEMELCCECAWEADQS